MYLPGLETTDGGQRQMCAVQSGSDLHQPGQQTSERLLLDGRHGVGVPEYPEYPESRLFWAQMLLDCLDAHARMAQSKLYKASSDSAPTCDLPMREESINLASYEPAPPVS
jgi:hypothetical protein